MGKSSGGTTGFQYFMDLHFVASLGEGGSPASPVPDALLRIIAGDRVAWKGAVVQNQTIHIFAPELFGGDEKEGGLVGFFDIMFGGPEQPINNYLLSAQGAPQSAFRGLFGGVYRQGQVSSNNPYIKPWIFQRRRITGDWFGGSCWYEEKAPILVGSTSDETLVTNDANILANTSSLDGLAGGYDFFVPAGADIVIKLGPSSDGWSFTPADDYQPENYSNLTWWNRFGLRNLDIDLVLGTGYLGTRYSTAAEARAANAGTEIVIPSGVGGNFRLFLFDAEVDDNRGSGSYSISFRGGATDYAMNPAHVIYQCLTDQQNGMGFPAAAIDEPSFIKSADQLYAEGLGVNLRWTTEATIESFVGTVQDHAGGMIVRDRRTGKYKFKLLRRDYVIDDLPVFNESNAKITGSAQRPSPADAVNELQVTYTDYRTGKDASTTVRNSAAQHAVGRIVSRSHSLTGIPTEDLAQRCGMRDLDAMSLPLWRFDLTLLRGPGSNLEPGDPFRFVWPPLGIDTVMRVSGEITYGNALDGAIRVPCVEDVFHMPDSVYTGSAGSPNHGPTGAALKPAAVMLEAPYRDLAGRLPADTLAELPDDASYVAAVAVRANGAQVNYDLQTRIAPAAFEQVSTGDFAGSALLASAVLPLDIGLPVTGEVDTDRLTVGSAAFLGEGRAAEMVRIVAVHVGVIEVARGCGDTVPQPWPAGTRLWGYEDHAAADPTQYMDGETIDGLAISRAPQGQATSLPMSVTPDHRPIRPYPPGQVRSGGVLVLTGSDTLPDVPDPPDPTDPVPGPLSPTGTPASTTPGPNGGFPDPQVTVPPFPVASGSDEIGPDGDFDNPGALDAWTQQDGSPLDPTKWTVVGDRAQCHALGLNTPAFHRGSAQTLPWLPFPRYTVTVSGYLQTDADVEAAVGLGIVYSIQVDQPLLGNHSAPASYVVETLVSYVFELELQQPLVTFGNAFVTQVIMPMILHRKVGGGPGNATFRLVSMTVDPVVVPTTELFPDGLDIPNGMVGWKVFPVAPPDLFNVTGADGVITFAPQFSYATECTVYLDTPLTDLDLAGIYAIPGGEVWSNDTKVITDNIGSTTSGGVSFGLITVGGDGQVIGRLFGAQERGDWSAREAYIRAGIANGTGGITYRWAARMRASPGKLAKFRNPTLSRTDDPQD